MAERYTNSSDHFENLSPSLVIPDHFSCSQSSTIVIIYDEPVGSPQDQVIFVFPGEVKGSPLKKVVPQRVDRRTFIIDTPIYNTSNRGFLYVTPQVRFASGQLKEMSDIRISLKHPVRSVMELCLRLSTQNAVLPVLLALVIHSKEPVNEEDTDEYHLLQDAHFDRIMATLVGSIEPGTKYLREVLLPSRKWKKCSLEEFARKFKMQEMEKQAYMLRQRGKDKRKGKHNVKDELQVHSEDEQEDPFYPLGQSKLSTSTPEIFHASEHDMGGTSSVRPRHHGVSSSHSIRMRNLPQLPIKSRSYQEDQSQPHHSDWNFNLGKNTIHEAKEEATNEYDPVIFDELDELEQLHATNSIATPKKHLMLKKPIIPMPSADVSHMGGGIGASFNLSSLVPKKTRVPKKKNEDTVSLDSYEDMNSQVNKEEEDEDEGSAWDQTTSAWIGQREATRPLPSPPSVQPLDPSTRPQLPLPPASDPIKFSPSHQYSTSTKKKKKKDETTRPGSRPMPSPPKEPPPSTKRPLPEPKPVQLKPRSGKRKGVRPAQSFRKKDIYVPESVSSEEEDKVQFTPGLNPMGVPRAASENDIFELEEPHLYEAPDLAEEVKKRTKKFIFKREEPVVLNTVAGTNNNMQEPAQLESSQYQNLPLQRQPQQQPEQPPDLPPPLLPRNHPPPSFPPPVPQSDTTTGSSSLLDTSSPSQSQQRIVKKVLPVPPTKQKAATLTRVQMESSPSVGHKMATRVRSNPPRTGNHEQMSELSAVLMSRGTTGPPPPPKHKLKKVPPVGGMKYI